MFQFLSLQFGFLNFYFRAKIKHLQAPDLELHGRSVKSNGSQICESDLGLGILEFQIRILKDLIPKSLFILDSWNRNDNSN